MSAHSGKHGELTVGSCSSVNELRSWEFEGGDDTPTYFSRNGAGSQQTVDGAFSGSGSFMINWDPSVSFSSSVATTGQLVQLNLYAQRSGFVQCSGQARLGKFKYGPVNRDGTIVTITIPFQTHGPWTIN